MKNIIIHIILFATFLCVTCETDCNSLLMGQYICPNPEYDLIDPKTQQLKGCTKEKKSKVPCLAAEGITCLESHNSTFYKDFDCKWTNGYHFDTALLLSIFFGMFGLDRFYLGYPAIGLAKFFTLGFMFLGQLIDIILIATQVVGPADGSSYVMPFFGPAVEVIRSTNSTFRLNPEECVDYPKPLEGKLSLNNKLEYSEKWLKGSLYGPESFASWNGTLYASIHGGYVVNITGNKVVPIVKLGKPCEEDFEEKICGRPLGMQFDKNGSLIVADPYYGIFKVNIQSGKKINLVSTDIEINGYKPKIPNSVAVASNGDIFWTDSSTDFLLQDGIYAVLSDGSGR
ncbi:unnamed protein product [Brassicogethes aeneus]|uniref:TM2 domain-containing protein n=1 Tax=Brassicogethes aeneus TaxID=1431903 RepID=A0A9P0FFF5_BRAAE|nr:unnamed protein product [Brassicogethes aeneus]